MMQREAMSQRQSILTLVENKSIMELVALAAGIWLFISHLIIGPFVRTFISEKLLDEELKTDEQNLEINEIKIDI